MFTPKSALQTSASPPPSYNQEEGASTRSGHDEAPSPDIMDKALHAEIDSALRNPELDESIEEGTLMIDDELLETMDKNDHIAKKPECDETDSLAELELPPIESIDDREELNLISPTAMDLDTESKGPMFTPPSSQSSRDAEKVPHSDMPNLNIDEIIKNMKNVDSPDQVDSNEKPESSKSVTSLAVLYNDTHEDINEKPESSKSVTSLVVLDDTPEAGDTEDCTKNASSLVMDNKVPDNEEKTEVTPEIKATKTASSSMESPKCSIPKDAGLLIRTETGSSQCPKAHVISTAETSQSESTLCAASPIVLSDSDGVEITKLAEPKELDCQKPSCENLEEKDEQLECKDQTVNSSENSEESTTCETVSENSVKESERNYVSEENSAPENDLEHQVSKNHANEEVQGKQNRDIAKLTTLDYSDSEDEVEEFDNDPWSSSPIKRNKREEREVIDVDSCGEDEEEEFDDPGSRNANIFTTVSEAAAEGDAEKSHKVGSDESHIVKKSRGEVIVISDEEEEVEIVEGEKKGECDKCDKRFDTTEKLQIHKEQNHNELPNVQVCNVCVWCDFITMSATFFNRHTENHTCGMHRCSYCGELLRSVALLHSHEKKHKIPGRPHKLKMFGVNKKPGTIYRCSHCSVQSSVSAVIGQHVIDNHRKHYCSECHRYYPDYLTYMKHVSHDCKLLAKTVSQMNQVFPGVLRLDTYKANALWKSQLYRAELQDNDIHIKGFSGAGRSPEEEPAHSTIRDCRQILNRMIWSLNDPFYLTSKNTRSDGSVVSALDMDHPYSKDSVSNWSRSSGATSMDIDKERHSVSSVTESPVEVTSPDSSNCIEISESDIISVEDIGTRGVGLSESETESETETGETEHEKLVSQESETEKTEIPGSQTGKMEISESQMEKMEISESQTEKMEVSESQTDQMKISESQMEKIEIKESMFETVKELANREVDETESQTKKDEREHKSPIEKVKIIQIPDVKHELKLCSVVLEDLYTKTKSPKVSISKELPEPKRDGPVKFDNMYVIALAWSDKTGIAIQVCVQPGQIMEEVVSCVKNSMPGTEDKTLEAVNVLLPCGWIKYDVTGSGMIQKKKMKKRRSRRNIDMDPSREEETHGNKCSIPGRVGDGNLLLAKCSLQCSNDCKMLIHACVTQEQSRDDIAQGVHNKLITMQDYKTLQVTQMQIEMKDTEGQDTGVDMFTLKVYSQPGEKAEPDSVKHSRMEKLLCRYSVPIQCTVRWKVSTAHYVKRLHRGQTLEELAESLHAEHSNTKQFGKRNFPLESIALEIPTLHSINIRDAQSEKVFHVEKTKVRTKVRGGQGKDVYWWIEKVGLSEMLCLDKPSLTRREGDCIFTWSNGHISGTYIQVRSYKHPESMAVSVHNECNVILKSLDKDVTFLVFDAQALAQLDKDSIARARLPTTSSRLPTTSTRLRTTSTRLPTTTTQLHTTDTPLPTFSTCLPTTSTRLLATSTRLPITSRCLPTISTSALSPAAATSATEERMNIPVPVVNMSPVKSPADQSVSGRSEQPSTTPPSSIRVRPDVVLTGQQMSPPKVKYCIQKVTDLSPKMTQKSTLVTNNISPSSDSSVDMVTTSQENQTVVTCSETVYRYHCNKSQTSQACSQTSSKTGVPDGNPGSARKRGRKSGLYKTVREMLNAARSEASAVNFTTAANPVTTAANSVTTAANSVTTAVNSVTTAVNSVTTVVNSVTTAVNSVTTAVNSITTAVNSVTTAVNSVTTAVNSVDTPLNSVTTAAPTFRPYLIVPQTSNQSATTAGKSTPHSSGARVIPGNISVAGQGFQIVKIPKPAVSSTPRMTAAISQPPRTISPRQGASVLSKTQPAAVSPQASATSAASVRIPVTVNSSIGPVRMTIPVTRKATTTGEKFFATRICDARPNRGPVPIFSLQASKGGSTFPVLRSVTALTSPSTPSITTISSSPTSLFTTTKQSLSPAMKPMPSLKSPALPSQQPPLTSSPILVKAMPSLKSPGLPSQQSLLTPSPIPVKPMPSLKRKPDVPDPENEASDPKIPRLLASPPIGKNLVAQLKKSDSDEVIKALIKIVQPPGKEGQAAQAQLLAMQPSRNEVGKGFEDVRIADVSTVKPTVTISPYPVALLRGSNAKAYQHSASPVPPPPLKVHGMPTFTINPRLQGVQPIPTPMTQQGPSNEESDQCSIRQRFAAPKVVEAPVGQSLDAPLTNQGGGAQGVTIRAQTLTIRVPPPLKAHGIGAPTVRPSMINPSQRVAQPMPMISKQTIAHIFQKYSHKAAATTEMKNKTSSQMSLKVQKSTTNLKELTVECMDTGQEKKQTKKPAAQVTEGGSSSNVMYSCERCVYNTRTLSKYEQHQQAHLHGKYVCKVCKKAMIKSSDLTKHWHSHKMVTTDDELMCDSCAFTIPASIPTAKSLMEDHMKRHYYIKHPDKIETMNEDALETYWASHGYGYVRLKDYVPAIKIPAKAKGRKLVSPKIPDSLLRKELEAKSHNSALKKKPWLSQLFEKLPSCDTEVRCILCQASIVKGKFYDHAKTYHSSIVQSFEKADAAKKTCTRCKSVYSNRQVHKSICPARKTSKVEVYIERAEDSAVVGRGEEIDGEIILETVSTPDEEIADNEKVEIVGERTWEHVHPNDPKSRHKESSSNDPNTTTDPKNSIALKPSSSNPNQDLRSLNFDDPEDEPKGRDPFDDSDEDNGNSARRSRKKAKVDQEDSDGEDSEEEFME